MSDEPLANSLHAIRGALHCLDHALHIVEELVCRRPMEGCLEPRKDDGEEPATVEWFHEEFAPGREWSISAINMNGLVVRRCDWANGLWLYTRSPVRSFCHAFFIPRKEAENG